MLAVCWPRFLSGGNATHQIAPDVLKETGLSQVFLAFDLSSIDHANENTKLVDQVINYVQGSEAAGEDKVRYPGQRTLKSRKQNLAEGIPPTRECGSRFRRCKCRA
jgi:3-dehydro-L-gulonate 2-dehydrogenase